jgi:hypothetical protein
MSVVGAITHVAPKTAALDQRLDQGGEVVVAQDQVGRLAGDLGAGAAHGHPDIGQSQ